MNLNLKFLTYEQIILLHEDQINEHGGLHGIKDEGLARSAIAQPQTSFGSNYLHKDIYEMAAAYLYHLVKNHPFVDGNKRIAALSAAVFLEVNGYLVIADEDEFELLVMNAAQSLVNKNQIADFFRVNTRLKV